MANLPSATTTVSETAGASGAGLDRICVLSPVSTDADMIPRQIGSADAIYTKHGFCEGVGYAALHFARTGKPIVFVGLPIDIPGAVSRHVVGGASGTCATSVTAGADGVLAEHDGVLRVIRGGLVGTDSIILGLSLDGGRTEKRVRLGQSSSYIVPYFGVTIGFTVGTLVTGETVHTWHGSAPTVSMVDVATARANLAADSKQFRTMLLCSVLLDATECSAFVDELNAYDTQNQRFVTGRGDVPPHRVARMSQHRVAMTGDPLVTFAEVGATGDTITRATGSFATDGFVVDNDMVITVRGAAIAGNNVTEAYITDATATVLILDTTDLAAEAGVSGVTIIGSYMIELSSVGAGIETITRHDNGSFVADGFVDGDTITLSHALGTMGGAAGTYVVTNAGDEVLTVLDPDVNFAGGNYASYNVTISAAQSLTDWMTESESDFDSIAAQSRIDLGAGRGRVTCPFSGWYLRRPAAWAASLREYQHDVHIPTWRKSDGPTGFSLEDADGTTVEWDDRTGGGAGSQAAFTTLRTWANGPAGAFVAVSVTRANEDQMQSYTHNKAVINHAQTIVHRSTESVAIGQSLVLNSDGTATKDSLRSIEAPVNAALANELLTNRQQEGQRASAALWTADPSVVYTVPEPTMLGTLELLLNGTVHSVSTVIRVQRG